MEGQQGGELPRWADFMNFDPNSRLQSMDIQGGKEGKMKEMDRLVREMSWMDCSGLLSLVIAFAKFWRLPKIVCFTYHDSEKLCAAIKSMQMPWM